MKNDVIIKLNSLTKNYLKNEDINIINLYEKKYMSVLEKIDYHSKIEPLKIFKISHKKWKKKKNILDKELDNSFNELMDKYKN